MARYRIVLTVDGNNIKTVADKAIQELAAIAAQLGV